MAAYELRIVRAAKMLLSYMDTGDLDTGRKFMEVHTTEERLRILQAKDFYFLHDAVDHNHLGWAQYLLESGTDVNQEATTLVNMSEGSFAVTGTPLFLATTYNFVEMAELLLNHGADVNAKACCDDNEECDGLTPLHIACEFGNLDMVRLITSRNPDFEARTTKGDHCLHRVVGPEQNRITVAECLRYETVDVKNGDGITPLMVAVIYHLYDMVDYFIAKGADLFEKNSRDYNSVEISLYRRDWAMTRHLMTKIANRKDRRRIEKGLEILTGVKLENMSAMHCAHSKRDDQEF